MMCPICKADGRILHVDEAPEGVTVLYMCANPRCTSYKQEFASEVLQKDTTADQP